tara:strand:- start:406 stop:705 length:300 start_codon:yes stop_codon:yes gene_type:complete
MSYFIIEACKILKPEADVAIEGTLISDINWFNLPKSEQPSDAEIQTQIDKLTKEFNDSEYSRNRGAAYPNYAEQLDEIYHNGLESWKAKIKTIKDKYPK